MITGMTKHIIIIIINVFLISRDTFIWSVFVTRLFMSRH
jgi:hypothetical protein